VVRKREIKYFSGFWNGLFDAHRSVLRGNGEISEKLMSVFEVTGSCKRVHGPIHS
jgi:hypothetical protein